MIFSRGFHFLVAAPTLSPVLASINLPSSRFLGEHRHELCCSGSALGHETIIKTASYVEFFQTPVLFLDNFNAQGQNLSWRIKSETKSLRTSFGLEILRIYVCFSDVFIGGTGPPFYFSSALERSASGSAECVA